MNDRSEFAVRLSFVTTPDTTRAQAERMATSIQRHAEKLSGISHTYDREVASEDDDMRMTDVELHRGSAAMAERLARR